MQPFQAEARLSLNLCSGDVNIMSVGFVITTAEDRSCPKESRVSVVTVQPAHTQQRSSAIYTLWPTAFTWWRT